MKQVLVTLLIAIGLAACVSKPEKQIVRTGAFLDETEQPNLVALLPPPPAAGSPAAEADQIASEAFLKLMDTPRWDIAILDAAMRAPGGATVFSCAANIPISEETTPLTMRVLRNTGIDIAMATRAPKKHYQRKRPFMTNEQPVCTPSGLRFLQKDGSYPSGHSSAGWAWGLLLAELIPDKADALVERGWHFGQSRAVCNVHWQSDIEQGRIVGSAIVAKLHSNRAFRAAMADARDELAKVRSQNLPVGRDCENEATALAMGS